MMNEFTYSETHEVYTWKEYGAVGLWLFKLAGKNNIQKKLLELTYPVKTPSRPHVILIVSHCADQNLRSNERIIVVARY